MTNFLETNGARIAYDATGSGDPVVLIHAGVANRSMWDAQVEALQDRYRVIRYDTRGFGETESDAVAFSNRADVAALLDELGVDRAHVVGLSRGGSIALDFAIEFPDRVRSLTVVAGGISGYESPAEPPPETWEAVDAMEEAGDWPALADWETAYWADGPGQPTDRVPDIRRRVHEWVLANYLAEKEMGTPQPLDPPAAGRLAELRVPLLVMLGTLDDPGTTESMRHLAAAVPDAQLEEFPTAHMLNLEEPARFNSVLRAFLDGVTGS